MLGKAGEPEDHQESVLQDLGELVGGVGCESVEDSC